MAIPGKLSLFTGCRRPGVIAQVFGQFISCVAVDTADNENCDDRDRQGKDEDSGCGEKFLTDQEGYSNIEDYYRQEKKRPEERPEWRVPYPCRRPFRLSSKNGVNDLQRQHHKYTYPPPADIIG